ncbi:Hydrolase [Flavobacterium sp. 9AF]|uniref:DUF5916 domain-containing protein n=1 Tax=Flavobacterium sp. 9AF TaxID=2653142 RepID=UPI0012F31952|nr:DUF5916 domain-containing protein [Flavobacterium sp. 9AF]VXB11352.1 Hydrolase [Flavobacterium sp. 9AF]
MHNNFVFCLLLLLFSKNLFCQEIKNKITVKKTIKAERKISVISIDGQLDEEDWSKALPANNFFTFSPDNGNLESPDLKSEVKILYDNDAIYIGATLFDNEPHKILKEITERDDFGTSDLFGVFINGYNDGQQDFQFYVSAANGQGDCNFTSQNGEDYSWNAIWSSNVKITNFGWVVEMKIPYAALRFPKKDLQTWGINFFREVRRNRQKYTWNPIYNDIGAFSQQAGILTDIQYIEPPTRLFLIPYTSAYYVTNKEESELTFKGGLDIKYGINDAFTLDAILIPDFGQTKFDNVELNLGPFEQQFNENRPFFTEGTDLFNKGNLLYTRRIGASPLFYPDLNENESIEEFPKSTNLLNALKISGRNNDGLGIGFLNAITEETTVNIKNEITNNNKSEIVSPLTNYNVTVFDQRFNQNSSITFINTNVTRNGHFRDANVTGLIFDLNTTKNTYNLSGKINWSNTYDIKNQNGIESALALGETSGNYRFSLGGEYISKDFDKNDLGIIFQTNYYSYYGNVSYKILTPTKTFNSFNIGLYNYMEHNNDTNEIQNNNFSLDVNTTSKDNHYYGFGYRIKPFERFDYYEPRQDGKFLILPKLQSYWLGFSSNYNYKFAFDLQLSHLFYNQSGRYDFDISLSPRYRFNDKFSLIYAINPYIQKNNIGFIDYLSASNEIIMAQRNRNTINNSLTSKFSINSQMNFNLSVRHYWSFAENNTFYSLLNNGRLIEKNDYTDNKNSNFSTWNLDLSYSWWFAPGSQATILYRNNASNYSSEIDKNFKNNFNSLLTDNLNHTFSISIRYFIDYNQAKNWIKKS